MSRVIVLSGRQVGRTAALQEQLLGRRPGPGALVPDAVLDPGPLGWLSPGFAGAGSKPPLDDQRGRR